MNAVFISGTGLFVGAFFTWLFCASYFRKKYSDIIRNTEDNYNNQQNLASAKEAVIGSLENQIKKMIEEMDKLRAKSETALLDKTKAETQVCELEKRVDEEKKLIDVIAVQNIFPSI